jgi:hypothetical protein
MKPILGTYRALGFIAASWVIAMAGGTRAADVWNPSMTRYFATQLDEAAEKGTPTATCEANKRPALGSKCT